MKRHKRLISLVLAVLMVAALLAGCGGTGDGDTGDTGKPNSGTTGGNTGGQTDSEDHPDTVYIASFKELPQSTVELSYISSAVFSNGLLYMVGEYEGDEITETDPVTGETWTYNEYKYGIFRLDPTDGTIELMPGYSLPQIPEGMEGHVYPNRLCVSPDGSVWVSEYMSTYYFDLPEDFDPTTDDRWMYYTVGQETTVLRKLDVNGAELMSLDLYEILQIPEGEYFYTNDITMDGKGNLYILRDTSVCLVTAEGEYVGDITAKDPDTWIQSLVRLKDGSVGCLYYSYDSVSGQGRYVILPINFTDKTWGEELEAPDAWNIYPGDDKYDFYFSDSSNFYGWSSETGETTKIFNWINCNVNPDSLSAVAPMSDGSVLAVTSEWRGDGRSMELVTVKEVPYDSVPQKTVLTYACMYVDYNIRSLIIDFNKRSNTHRIEVLDYSEYNTPEDYTAGLTKLTTEILGGKVPDIIATSNLPISRYAARGLLEDLWQWIDKDTELGGRDGLVEPIFNALTDDQGKLWQITPSFSIFTVMGPTGLVGDRMGWTLQELLAAHSQMPQGANIFDKYMTRDSIMNLACYMNLSEFVDWTTGKCTFDSQEFIDILKFAQMFPETYEWSEDEVYVPEYQLFKSGAQMLQYSSLSDFQYYQYLKAVMGGSVSFVGFPTTDGTGSAFQVNSGLAMSSQCKDKEGAWSFIRTILTKDYQDEYVWDFPTNKELFDDMLESASTPTYITDPETGEQVEESTGSWWMDDGTPEGFEIKMFALRQNEVDQIMSLIESTDRVYTYDDVLYNIIMEQCAPFFAGEKSAEETAKLVQGRVNIYVNEQR